MMVTFAVIVCDEFRERTTEVRLSEGPSITDPPGSRRSSVSMLAVFVAMRQIARTETVDGSSPMPEHVRYLLEALRDDGEFTLYRGHEPGEQASVLIVAPAAEQPSPQSLRQLEHECALAADLDPAWAARPVEVTRRNGRTMLILEDPGGEPLDRVLERN